MLTFSTEDGLKTERPRSGLLPAAAEEAAGL